MTWHFTSRKNHLRWAILCTSGNPHGTGRQIEESKQKWLSCFMFSELQGTTFEAEMWSLVARGHLQLTREKPNDSSRFRPRHVPAQPVHTHLHRDRVDRQPQLTRARTRGRWDFVRWRPASWDDGNVFSPVELRNLIFGVQKRTKTCVSQGSFLRIVWDFSFQMPTQLATALLLMKNEIQSAQKTALYVWAALEARNRTVNPFLQNHNYLENCFTNEHLAFMNTDALCF